MQPALSAPELVAAIGRRVLSSTEGDVLAFWFLCDGDRDEYRQDIEMTAPVGTIPLVVRTQGFDSPNAILVDLVALLEANRQYVSERVRSAEGGPVVLVLLARAPLFTSQAASPATLPEWFPGLGGKTVTCVIEDLSFTADVTLSDPSGRLGLINEQLHRLEGALIRCLRRSRHQDPKPGVELYQHIADAREKEGDPITLDAERATARYDAFLVAADGAHGAVHDARVYRPTVKDGSVVGSLVLLLRRNAPDGVAKLAATLQRALALDEEVTLVAAPLAAVLMRPTSPITDQAQQLAFTCLATVFAAYQITTAVAHADAYPRYPWTLLRGMSHDLRRALAALANSFDSARKVEEATN